MTRTDTFVVGTLVLVLALVAALIGVPALQLSSSTSPLASAPGGSGPATVTGRTSRARSARRHR